MKIIQKILYVAILGLALAVNAVASGRTNRQTIKLLISPMVGNTYYPNALFTTGSLTQGTENHSFSCKLGDGDYPMEITNVKLNLPSTVSGVIKDTNNQEVGKFNETINSTQLTNTIFVPVTIEGHVNPNGGKLICVQVKKEYHPYPGIWHVLYSFKSATTGRSQGGTVTTDSNGHVDIAIAKELGGGTGWVAIQENGCKGSNQYIADVNQPQTIYSVVNITCQ